MVASDAVVDAPLTTTAALWSDQLIRAGFSTGTVYVREPAATDVG